MVPIATVLFGVACLVACARPNPDPASLVAEALHAAGLDGIAVDYDPNVARLRLRGTVASRIDRNRALDVAMDTIGRSAATISNELTVTEPQTAPVTDDDRIKREILRALEQHRALQRRGIGVEVAAGVVTLSGSVATLSEKSRARVIARSITEVKDVVDRLAVKRTTP